MPAVRADMAGRERPGSARYGAESAFHVASTAPRRVLLREK